MIYIIDRSYNLYMYIQANYLFGYLIVYMNNKYKLVIFSDTSKFIYYLINYVTSAIRWFLKFFLVWTLILRITYYY